MKQIILFSFNFNNKTWCWERTFYSANIENNIQQYLENKKLPFELKASQVNWKIKK